MELLGGRGSSRQGSIKGLNLRLRFNEGFQPGKGLIPLSGDLVEIVSDFLNGSRVKFEEAFAALANGVNESSVLEHAEVFGDCLPAQLRAMSQLADGTSAPLAELCEERQTCFVAQCGKDGRMRLPPGCHGTTTSL